MDALAYYQRRKGRKMNILVDGKVFLPQAFSRESEFETLVTELSDQIFGENTIYVDIKRRIGRRGIISIPDGYLIDMTVPNEPKLYIIENEIVGHDPFRHIGIQLLRFTISFEDNRNQIRSLLMDAINEDSAMLERLERGCANSDSRNIDNYLDRAVFQDFKGIVLIDEARPELHKVLSKINANISVLELKRYVSDDDEEIYQYDLLYEDPDLIEHETTDEERARSSIDRANRRRLRAESDTIVVPAQEEGFRNEFIGNSHWYAIMIGAAMKDRIKYIVAYQVSPISAVTHIAEIQEIKPYNVFSQTI